MQKEKQTVKLTKKKNANCNIDHERSKRVLIRRSSESKKKQIKRKKHKPKFIKKEKRRSKRKGEW